MSALDFKNNKYCYVNNVLDKKTLDIVTNYTLLDEEKNFYPEPSGGQVPGSHSKYSDILMESILLSLKDTVEKNTGLELYPTYSYYRVYRPGQSLEPHIDRESCEISASLFIGHNYDGETWKLYIEDAGYSMSPGDMIIYRGMELSHYRYEFIAPENSFHSQVFLHYVDANGPYKDYKLDNRNSHIAER